MMINVTIALNFLAHNAKHVPQMDALLVVKVIILIRMDRIIV